MNKTITKSIIAEHIQNNLGFSKNLSDALVSEVFETLVGIIVSDSKIKLPNFGSFSIHTKPSRPGVNLHTKTKMTIVSRDVIRFVPSRNLKTLVNNEK